MLLHDPEVLIRGVIFKKYRMVCDICGTSGKWRTDREDILDDVILHNLFVRSLVKSHMSLN